MRFFSINLQTILICVYTVGCALFIILQVIIFILEAIDAFLWVINMEKSMESFLVTCPKIVFNENYFFPYKSSSHFPSFSDPIFYAEHDHTSFDFLAAIFLESTSY